MSYADWDSDEYDAFISDPDSDFETVQSPNSTISQDPRRQLEEQIQEAASNGRLAELKAALIDNKIGVGINSPLSGGWTALMYAAFSSQSEIVSYLIDNKADVNKDAHHMTPLMCACASQSNSKLSNFASVKKLVEAKAKVNIIDNNRQTPLMRAIENGKIDIAKFLIPKANLEMMDSLGRTAVFYAVIHKQDEILKYLIEMGASLDKHDKYKNTIKDLAIVKNHAPTLNIIQKYLPDRENLYDDFILENMTDWKEMFPGILPSDKPAYWYEIPALLFGMHCEKALKPLKEAQVDLSRFLTLTEDDMKDLNITFPYLRKRLKAGLYKFHSYKWNMSTVLGYSSNLNKNMDFKTCLDYFGSHLKHLTVMKSTYIYINKNAKINKTSLPPEMESRIDKIISQISDMKVELRKFEEIILKVNKQNLVPADLITAPKKTYISRKCWFYVTILSSALIITAIKTIKY